MSKLHVGPCPLLSEGARPESSGAVSSDVKKWQTCAVAESDRPLLPGTTAQLRLPALAPTKGHDRGHMPVFYHPDDVSSRGNPTHTWEGGARPATGRNVATPQQHSGIAFGTTSTPLERSREPVHSCRHSAFLVTGIIAADSPPACLRGAVGTPTTPVFTFRSDIDRGFSSCVFSNSCALLSIHSLAGLG